MGERLTVDYARKGGWHAITLPYAGERFRLTVLTAEDATRSTDLWRGLVQGGGIAALLGGMAYRRQEIDVRLPRFRVEFSSDLTGKLARLGLADALSPRAHYSRLSAAPLGMLQVVQRAVFDVNESGTEAAAATAVIGTRSLKAGPPQFTADRPFIIALGDKETGLLLFLGYIAEP
jgi:serpin B